MTIPIILIILTVPIFYILGFVQFLSFFIHSEDDEKDGKNRVSYLTRVIRELQIVEEKTPQKKVVDQLKIYKEELENLQKSEIKSDVTVQPVVSHEVQKKQEMGISWENWYSNNSINLLLYIGAFLIVAAASILVGFQWETISNIAKALLLSCLTVAFFFFGLWFYQMQKIRNAGVTFIGIGALLFPITGYGWHVFVLKALGIPGGTVWLITSLLTLAVYFFLAWYLRAVFYSYIASVATLSLFLSFVNIFHLNNDYYILASIVASFTLLIVRIFFAGVGKKDRSLYITPIEFSSYIIMPITLFYGLLTAAAHDQLFTPEASISLFLAALYYGVSYTLLRQTWCIIVAEILYPISFILLFQWEHVQNYTVLYVLSGLTLCDLFIGYLLRKYELQEESDASILIALIKFILLALFAYSVAITPIHQTLYAVLATVAGLLAVKINKNIYYTLYSVVFLSISLYLFYKAFWPFVDHSILSVPYLGLGIGCYAGSIHFRKSLAFVQTFSVASAFYFLLSILLALSHPGYLIIISCIISIVFLSAASVFSVPSAIYGSNLFIVCALLNALWFFHAPISSYPFYFSGLSYIFYLIHAGGLGNFSKEYRASACIGAIGTPILFGLYSLGSFYSDTIEHNALISAYSAVILLSYDAWKKRSENMGYFASAVAMTTYLWQMKVFHMTQTQMYTLPLGLYFLTLSYLRSRRKDTANRDLFDFLGLGFLLIPTVLQAFGAEGVGYAFLLGVEGILLLCIGISFLHKPYTYAGVAGIVLAVISQTYSYIFSLPWWVVVGIFGFGFLGVAVYLLLYRKEPDKT